MTLTAETTRTLNIYGEGRRGVICKFKEVQLVFLKDRPALWPQRLAVSQVQARRVFHVHQQFGGNLDSRQRLVSSLFNGRHIKARQSIGQWTAQTHLGLLISSALFVLQIKQKQTNKQTNKQNTKNKLATLCYCVTKYNSISIYDQLWVLL